MMNQYYGRSSRTMNHSSLLHSSSISGRRPSRASGLPSGGYLPCGNSAGGNTSGTANGGNHTGCGCGRGCGCEGHAARRPPVTGSNTAPRREELGCGCGCGHSGKNPSGDACKRLMEQIRAVDFALYETVLYLDVYPHSSEALETYHKLRAQSEALRRKYEETCGPLTAFSNRSDTSWDWMDQPFPWEYDAD